MLFQELRCTKVFHKGLWVDETGFVMQHVAKLLSHGFFFLSSQLHLLHMNH